MTIIFDNEKYKNPCYDDGIEHGSEQPIGDVKVTVSCKGEAQYNWDYNSQMQELFNIRERFPLGGGLPHQFVEQYNNKTIELLPSHPDPRTYRNKHYYNTTDNKIYMLHAYWKETSLINMPNIGYANTFPNARQYQYDFFYHSALSRTYRRVFEWIEKRSYNSCVQIEECESIDGNPTVDALIINAYYGMIRYVPARQTTNTLAANLNNHETTFISLITDLYNSPEHMNRNLNDYDFVTALYRAILGRGCSDSEIYAWLNLNLSRTELIDEFIKSDECVAICNKLNLINKSVNLTATYNNWLYRVVSTGIYDITINVARGGTIDSTGSLKYLSELCPITERNQQLIINYVSHSTGDPDSSITGYTSCGSYTQTIGSTLYEGVGTYYRIIKHTLGVGPKHILEIEGYLESQDPSKPRLKYGHRLRIKYEFYDSHVNINYMFGINKKVSYHENFYMWDMAIDISDMFTHYQVPSNIYRVGNDPALFLLHPSGYIPLGTDWLSRKIPEFGDYPWTGDYELPDVAKNAGISSLLNDCFGNKFTVYKPGSIAIQRILDISKVAFHKWSIYSNPKTSSSQSHSFELFHTNDWYMAGVGKPRPRPTPSGYTGVGLINIDIDDMVDTPGGEQMWFGVNTDTGFTPLINGTGPNLYI